VQPAAHARVAIPATPMARQTGPAAEVVQSALVMQPTQVNVAVSQRGVVPEQLLSTSHCTHSFEAPHTGLAVGQVMEVMQPTHAPVVGSHTLGWPIPAGHIAPPSPHAAWQVWLLGQQTGVVPVPQSALVAHATHALFRQCGVAVGQFMSVKHWTHPAGTPGAVQSMPASWPPPLLPPSVLPPLLPAPLLPAPLLPPPPLLPAPLLLPPPLLLPCPLLLPPLPLPPLLVLSPPPASLSLLDESPLQWASTRGRVAAKGKTRTIQWMFRLLFMGTPKSWRGDCKVFAIHWLAQPFSSL
jgi:hypothetical protein